METLATFWESTYFEVVEELVTERDLLFEERVQHLKTKSELVWLENQLEGKFLLEQVLEELEDKVRALQVQANEDAEELANATAIITRLEQVIQSQQARLDDRNLVTQTLNHREELSE